MNEYKIRFEEGRALNLRNAKRYKGVTGLYFIYNTELAMRYPYRFSNLIYIGMSEKSTNSVGGRLQNHLDGTSGNNGLVNYRSANELKVTVLNSQLFEGSWDLGVESLESYFILDFVREYGVYPICNNKSGYDILTLDNLPNISIDWARFEQ